jgi:hypothetical protein
MLMDIVYSPCYVVVPVEDGWLGLDTLGVKLSERIGKVITVLEMWKLCDTPKKSSLWIAAVRQ